MPAPRDTPEAPPARQPRWRGLAANLALAMVSIGLTLVVAEVGFRWLLFETDWLASQQRPGLYADYSFDDDYWKLQYRWQQKYPPPSDPHPLLGWVAEADPETLVHVEADQVGDRRPVLLYGDSFAQSVPQATRFGKLLNGLDPSFSAEHYLLNYGTGGYGLDQIVLLMEQTLDLYDDPYVVFSFLTYDIDRAMLSVRTGQKPYFELVDDRLELRGLPIERDPHAYFERHPPTIRSYLWRRLLFARGRPSNRLVARLRHEGPKRTQKMQLNEKLLERAFDLLESRGLDFTVLLFTPERSLRGVHDWRDSWLERTLRATGHDLIVASDVLWYHAPNASVDELIVEGNGHPSTFYNQLIADEIRRRVLARQEDP
ncbi:MAG: hypothetical protein AAGE94_05090 [Acidobacteriota bacterium]